METTCRLLCGFVAAMLSTASVFVDGTHKILHLDAAANHQRRTLMHALRLYLQYPPLAIKGNASGLFDQERDRVGLIEKAEFAAAVVASGQTKPYLWDKLWDTPGAFAAVVRFITLTLGGVVGS